MADSKLAKLLADKKIDPRRVLVASHELETLTREDRAIKLAKRRGKGGAAEEGAAKETRKPRSGRPERGLRVSLAAPSSAAPPLPRRFASLIARSSRVSVSSSCDATRTRRGSIFLSASSLASFESAMMFSLTFARLGPGAGVRGAQLETGAGP